MKRSIFILAILLIFGGIVDDVAFSQNKVDESLFNGLKYRNIGPSRGGRATAVAGIPTQPGTFFMGATGGGVWKTNDYGQSWFNVSDGYFETPSIGSIRVSLTDPNIVYVGTGSDGIRSNVIIGRGVYKSTDGGETWKHIGLRDAGQIGAVLIHPQNPDLVYVAALGTPFGQNETRGIYRSKDGGESWEKVFYISDRTGAVDLEFAPDNTDEIYASMWIAQRKPWTIISGGTEGGLYKTTDGGDSWNQLNNGLPNNIRGKSDIAVSAADPNRVYVLFEAPVGEGGVYRSDDRGASFTLVSTHASLLDRPFYYCNIDADPNNPDILWVNATGYWKSTDGGKNWKRGSTPHGDNHDMWINPNDSNLFIQCNDGGANVTRDGGKTWSTQYNQMTAELYQVAVDDQFPYWLYAGQQDNSTIMVPSLPPYSPAGGPTGYWQAIGGCETGPAIPKPGNHNIVYSNCKGRFGRYNKLTDQEQQFYVGASNIYGHNPADLKYRFQRVSPIHVSPHDPNIVYHGSQYLHKTTDDGETWDTISPDLTAFTPETQMRSGSPITQDITGEEHYSTLYAVQESPLVPGLIWTGANDGPVHVTQDAGKTWKNVTPKDMPGGGRVQNIEASPHKKGKAYFAAYRYLLNDFKPYIYKTEDYGQNWELLTTGTNGIPNDYPTRVVREDPHREGLLYAGTDFGMYISFDDGKNWQSFQLNLPVTPVTDIKIYRGDLVMSTMGRSFWIMDNITRLTEVGKSASTVELYTPRKAYRMRYRTFRGGEDMPDYPQAGATIDYSLGSNVSGDVIINIYNDEGDVVHSGTEMAEPGAHRYHWNLSYNAPRPMGASSRFRGPGILVVPGTYKVELTASEKTVSKKLTVKLDPRVSADGVSQADLKAQFDLSVKIRDLQATARTLARNVAEALESSKGNKKKRIQVVSGKINTEQGRYTQPMLLDQISYLSSMLSRADQKPGNHAYIRYDELVKWCSDVTNEFNKVR